MSKDPAFLFYPNDYIGGTMGMTFEEKGAYIELLMLQFNRGHMTKHMIGRTVGQLWDNIQDKFIKDVDGKYFNKRLEEEQTKRKAYSESRRNNKKGINQYTKSDGGHMTSHMGNENEDINSIVNNKKGREDDFRKQVAQHPYSKELIDEFCQYWTESKPKGRKLRFELEKVFDISRRLATWEKRQKGFKPEQKPETPQDREARLFMESLDEHNLQETLKDVQFNIDPKKLT